MLGELEMEKRKMLSVRVPEELLDQIDTWRANQRPIPPRAEVVRLALEKFLDMPKKAEPQH
jgi:Arc/MetJ-type ribon-helix-helix transcriptional regulator